MFDVWKFELVCLYVCRQLSGYLSNSVRLYPVKLKIGKLYHKKDTFRNTDFFIYADLPLINFFNGFSKITSYLGALNS